MPNLEFEEIMKTVKCMCCSKTVDVTCKNRLNKSIKIKGEKCGHCGIGTLDLIQATPPWDIEHLQCDHCDSTFNLEENR